MSRWSKEQLEQIRQRRMEFDRLHKSGMNPAKIAEKFGVTVPVVWSGIRALRKEERLAAEAAEAARMPKRKVQAHIFPGFGLNLEVAA